MCISKYIIFKIYFAGVERLHEAHYKKMHLRSKEMTHNATFEVSLSDGLQPVSLQQQQRQILQVLKSSWVDAADLVVGQSQLSQSSG